MLPSLEILAAKSLRVALRVGAVAVAVISAATFGGNIQAHGAADGPVKIGLMTDLQGPNSASTGPGSVVAVQMAIEDFGGKVLGKPIEFVSGDHQNKPDVGLALIRRWYDTEDVDVVMDVNNSAIALGVQKLTQEKDRVFLITGAGTAELTGTACSPNGVQWITDTYSMARAQTIPLTRAGTKKWYLLVVDYAYGRNMEQEVVTALGKNGGTVVGSVRHPFGNADFSAFLVRAQSTNPEAIALINSGQDLVNSVKQLSEFGITAKPIPFIIFISDIHAAGLNVFGGAIIKDVFYWDLNEQTRAFSKRFEERFGRKPTSVQADNYRAATHYLQAVEANGSKSALPVVKKMKELPFNNKLGDVGSIREDGRIIRDLLSFEVKKPAESKQPWDYLKPLPSVAAADIYRPLSESECPYIKK